MKSHGFAVLVPAILVIAFVAEADDARPPDSPMTLKKQFETAREILLEANKPGTSEAGQKEARDRFFQEVASICGRSLEFAKAHQDEPEAVEVLVWSLQVGKVLYAAKRVAECDATYDLLAERYLDLEAILPTVKAASNEAGCSTHDETFLRSALEKSKNPNVRAMACYSLGCYQHQLIRIKVALDDPIQGAGVANNFRPESVQRMRAVVVEEAKRKAEQYFDRTRKEFAAFQPMGKGSPPLGEQAEGKLYRLRNLEIGCKSPEIAADDLDGKPMKLSDYRGKVVLVSFWATWCGPCMGLVPEEKALVERMRGRPFVLLGVNGDEDLARAKAVSGKQGITWRSFLNGGPDGPISTTWGLSGWPTFYLIDADGVIRDNESYPGPSLERAIEKLVAEAETR